MPSKNYTFRFYPEEIKAIDDELSTHNVPSRVDLIRKALKELLGDKYPTPEITQGKRTDLIESEKHPNN